MQTCKLLSTVTVFLAASVTLFAQTSQTPDEAVRDVIGRFEVALQAHDIKAIEELVSSDIVVFENGHRNDGWPDFRDHHLLPEFKAPRRKYKTEVVRIEATPAIAWAYSKMNRAYVARKDDTPDVWAIYVLRKDATGWRVAMLDWSVRRVE